MDKTKYWYQSVCKLVRSQIIYHGGEYEDQTSGTLSGGVQFKFT